MQRYIYIIGIYYISTLLFLRPVENVLRLLHFLTNIPKSF